MVDSDVRREDAGHRSWPPRGADELVELGILTVEVAAAAT
ncbi:MAG: hypothetical protein K0R68_1885 [Mycobacterium sp.]|jgi:hypothetical protein|nr:hypothetical protein [Mycobacterium sp.]